MPDQIALQAERRTILGKSVRKLRRQGLMPAHIYGHNRESLAIQLNAHELARTIQTHGPTTIFRISITPDGAEETVLLSHVQHEPRTGAMQHVDFRHVEMYEAVHARVPVHYIGEAPAVQLLDGILVHPTDFVEVEAVPTSLPEAIEVDVTGLAEIGDRLTVADLKPPRGVQFLTGADETVVLIERPKVTPTEAAEPEVTPLEPNEEPEGTPSAGAPSGASEETVE